MGQRGKKSVASKVTALQIHQTAPEPPDDLNEFQRELWNKIVTTKPVDWFGTDTQEHLRIYCEMAYEVRSLNKRITGMYEIGAEIPQLKQACMLRDATLAKLLAIARSMRITQQTQIDGEKAHRNARSKAPSWARNE